MAANKTLGEGIYLLVRDEHGDVVQLGPGDSLPDHVDAKDFGDHVFAPVEDRAGLIDGEDPDDDDAGVPTAASDGDVPAAKKAAPAKKAAAKKSAPAK